MAAETPTPCWSGNEADAWAVLIIQSAPDIVLPGGFGVGCFMAQAPYQYLAAQIFTDRTTRPNQPTSGQGPASDMPRESWFDLFILRAYSPESTVIYLQTIDHQSCRPETGCLR